jgi:hypothetical protein
MFETENALRPRLETATLASREMPEIPGFRAVRPMARALTKH